MTYTLFSFVFMLMYGSFVAVLAYKAGKSERDKLIKAVNKKDNPVYFYRSAVDYVMLDKKCPDLALVHIKGERMFVEIDKNPWVDGFIKGAGK